jgi:hypothetical protein
VSREIRKGPGKPVGDSSVNWALADESSAHHIYLSCESNNRN